MFLDFIMMDEDYTPQSKPSFHGWGSNDTNTAETQMQLQEECLKTLAKKFNANPEEINTDVDAISVLITAEDLCVTKKKEVRNFFELFGTGWTLRCRIPNSVPGSLREDGVFSCYEDNKKCQHLPSYLHGKEMLVIDTPLKIALHISCKEKLTEELLRRKIHLSPTQGEGGLCFISGRAANLPNYMDVIDAIIDSCHVPSINLHIIHVADIGFKKNISPGKSTCPLLRFFEVQDAMRKAGVKVDNCQTDIAYTIPIQAHRLVQLSCKKRKREPDGCDCTHNKSILSNSKKEIYPIHGIPLRNGRIAKNDLAGTVSLKKVPKTWQKKDSIVISGADGEYRENAPINDTISYLYSANESMDGVPEMSINPSVIQSIKLYSEIYHSYGQHRKDFPFKETDIYHIGSKQIISLKRLLREIVLSASIAFAQTRNFPTHTRIEISIRPPHGDKLRSTGHYSDLLVCVVLAVCEICEGGEFEIDYRCSDPEPLLTHLASLETEVNSLLHCRSQYTFNQIYPSHRTLEWLRSQVTLMMITAGMAPQSNLKHIKNWLNDLDRFDPFKRADCLNSKPQVDIPSCDIDHKIYGIKIPFQNMLLQRGFSRGGAQLLAIFVCGTTEQKKSPLVLFTSLPFMDKLHLSRHLIAEIIPFISKHLSSDHDNDDKIETHDTETRMHQNNNVTDKSWTPFDSDDSHIPADSISKGVHRISMMASFSEFERPLFLPLLLSFILRCASSSVIELDETTTQKLSYCIDEKASLSNRELRSLCSNIKIDTPANQTNRYYTDQLCREIGFPCEGVDYREEDYYGDKPQSRSRNEILNEVFQLDLVQQIQTPCAKNKTTFFRNANNETIQINQRETVIENIPIEVDSDVCYSGYDAIAMISGVHDTSCNNEQLRNHVIMRLHKCVGDFKNIFLGESGKGLPQFQGTTDLSSLEQKHEFQLKTAITLDTMEKATKFIPIIMIPLISFATETNMAFYDFEKMDTYFCTHQGRKCIVYYEDNLDCRPKGDCTIIVRHTDGKYSSKSHSASQSSLTSPPNNRQPSHPVHHRHCLSFADTIPFSDKKLAHPDIISRHKDTFIDALQNAVKAKFRNPSSHPLLKSPLDISFLEQLHTHCTHPSVFDNSVMENCEILRRPFRAILNYLKNGEEQSFNHFNHELICPFVCLKYKITIAVFSRMNKKKKTTIYAFDLLSSKVVCQVHDSSYHVLDSRSQFLHSRAIYMWTSGKKTTYYRPCTRLCLLSSIEYDYFHIDISCLCEMMEIMKRTHDINFILKKDVISLRPESQNLIIPLSIKNTQVRNGSLEEIARIGIEHIAIIVIFPYEQHHGDDKWKGCIIHHPKQDKRDIENEFTCLQNSIPAHVLNNKDIDMTYIPGALPNECEAGLLMWLYVYIGHRSKSVNHLEDVTANLEASKVTPKLREWLLEIYRDKTTPIPYAPNWVDLLLTNSKSS